MVILVHFWWAGNFWCYSEHYDSASRFCYLPLKSVDSGSNSSFIFIFVNSRWFCSVLLDFQMLLCTVNTGIFLQTCVIWGSANDVERIYLQILFLPFYGFLLSYNHSDWHGFRLLALSHKVPTFCLNLSCHPYCKEAKLCRDESYIV
jgi:hypothetical protein